MSQTDKDILESLKKASVRKEEAQKELRKSITDKDWVKAAYWCDQLHIRTETYYALQWEKYTT